MPGQPVRNFVFPLLLLAAFAAVLFVTVRFMGGASLTDLRSRAWSGVTYNADRLGELAGFPSAGKKADPNPLSSAAADDPTSTKSLFGSLTRTYWDAQVQNISLPEFGIEGVALMKYDEALGKTLVFSRIAGLPYVSGIVVRLWIVRDLTRFVPVGIAEFFPEGTGRVAYSVFSYPGNLSDWEELLVSYDSSLSVAGPESVVIRLKF